jgi:hypothetical protein
MRGRTDAAFLSDEPLHDPERRLGGEQVERGCTDVRDTVEKQA